jgi:uncharacterized protein
MDFSDLPRLIVIFIGFIVAGSINAVAGGGTVFSFSGLLAGGLSSIVANATNAAALVPASITSTIAYRDDLKKGLRPLSILLIPTILGSLLGANAVLITSEQTFRRIVPFLVLFAVLVFAGRNFVSRIGKRNTQDAIRTDGNTINATGYVLGCLLQFVIAAYGGFFGAGIGILMLTSFNVMGMRDVHRMNAIKTTLATFINGTAAVRFFLDGKIDLPVALLGAVASAIGGYAIALVAKRIPQQTLRVVIVCAGLVVSAWMFWRFWL